LNILGAQLERLLIEERIDLPAVERKLREAMEYKVQMELAEIKFRVDLKNSLGSAKWEAWEKYAWYMEEQYQEEFGLDEKIAETITAILQIEYELDEGEGLRDRERRQMEKKLQELEGWIFEEIGEEEYLRWKEEWFEAEEED
jgi:hypothetical protein